MSDKPLLFADDRTDAEKFDPRKHRGTLDPSRVPGYSEIVMANDIAKADPLRFREANLGRTQEDVFREIGASPQKLPVEFKWLPISGPGGADLGRQRTQLDKYMNQQGFRLADAERDLYAHGYGFPPAARLAEDGTIRRGPDTALYVRSREVADMWEAFEYAEQKAIEGDSDSLEFNADTGERTDAWLKEEDRETVTVKH